MLEENKNVGNRLDTNSGTRDWINGMLDFQRNAIQQQQQKFSAEREDSANKRFVAWLSTTNHWVSKECNTSFRIYQVAEWIRKYFAKPENGWLDYYGVDDVPLVDDFKAQNPDIESNIWEYVLDDSQICDPTQLFYDIWLETPPEEEISEEVVEEESRSSPLTNIAWAVTESVLWLPKFVWNTSADIAAWTLKLFWWDEERANAAAEEVKSFMDKLSFWDEDSLLYKWTKITSDLVLAYLLGKWLVPQTNIGNLWWWTKSLLWAWQWVADMGLYSMISDQELPSKWEVNLWLGLWGFLPYGWLLWEWWKKLIKWLWKEEVERAIPKVSELSKTREDKFLKEFWQPFEEWMAERKLTTRGDINKYFEASKGAKMDAMRQIQWRYKAEELDDVVDWCVDWAKETKDPRLEEFLEYQAKNNEWWLEMWESEKVKQYFSEKWVFNFDGNKTSEEIDTLTNMYERLMNWQRKIAKENWFENLADINNEIQAWWYLNKYVKDLTKIWKKWMSLLDFVIAVSTWNWKLAASYLLSKNILGSAKINEKYAKLLQWIFKNWNGDKLAVDYEKIQSMQSEKEVIEYLKSLWIYDDALPYIEWWLDDAGKTILSDSETLIWTPDWKTVIKDKITEIPQASK